MRSDGAKASADYRLQPADIQAWERRHGRIAPGTIVLMHSGWGRFWKDRKQYFGSDQPGDIDAARRSTFSGMAAWLLDPMYLGAYPEAEAKAWARDMPKFPASDLRTIAQPLEQSGRTAADLLRQRMSDDQEEGRAGTRTIRLNLQLRERGST